MRQEISGRPEKASLIQLKFKVNTRILRPTAIIDCAPWVFRHTLPTSPHSPLRIIGIENAVAFPPDKSQHVRTIIPFIKGQPFNPDLVRIMGKAYDMACKALLTQVTHDSARGHRKTRHRHRQNRRVDAQEILQSRIVGLESHRKAASFFSSRRRL